MQTQPARRRLTGRSIVHASALAAGLGALVLIVTIVVAWSLSRPDSATPDAAQGEASIAVSQLDTSVTDRGMRATMGEGLITGDASVQGADAAAPEAGLSDAVIIRGPGEGVNEVLAAPSFDSSVTDSVRITGLGEGLNSNLLGSASGDSSNDESAISGPGEGAVRN